MTDVRGDLWEHGPGPSSSIGWAELFADTPNYCGLGRSVVGREAFRWHHGPMFLPGAARWFGQSPGGWPGGRPRRVALASFVHRWNGSADKESAVTWIEAHGGTARPESLHTASLGSLPSRVRVVGCCTPGEQLRDRQPRSRPTCARGRARQGLASSPTRLASSRHRRHAGSGRAVLVLLAGDTFRDFPFGTCPRLGGGGTSSNRSDDQRAIRLLTPARPPTLRGCWPVASPTSRHPGRRPSPNSPVAPTHGTWPTHLHCPNGPKSAAPD